MTSTRKERGGVDQRPGRLDIGALEADIIDVEAQVHELAVQMEEREVAIDRQAGASLTTPTSISGATSPAARAMARIRPVMMAGLAIGSTTRHRVSAWWHPLPGSLRGSNAGCAPSLPRSSHDHHRHGEQGQGQCGPQDTGRAQGRAPAGLRQRTSGRFAATEQVDEEAQAKHAIDDRRHAGEVVDGDADDARSVGPGLRVFTQVRCRKGAASTPKMPGWTIDR
jgi:hypothetical protein